MEAECYQWHTFSIEGIPVPQPRARLARSGSVYSNSKRVSVWKDRIKFVYEQSEGPFFSDPVCLQCNFYFDRPQDKKKHKSLSRYPMIRTPDIDNLLKAVMDGLNGYAWKDDRLVFKVEAAKYHCAKGDFPHVLIKVGKLA